MAEAWHLNVKLMPLSPYHDGHSSINQSIDNQSRGSADVQWGMRRNTLNAVEDEPRRDTKLYLQTAETIFNRQCKAISQPVDQSKAQQNCHILLWVIVDNYSANRRFQEHPILNHGRPNMKMLSCWSIHNYICPEVPENKSCLPSFLLRD